MNEMKWNGEDLRDKTEAPLDPKKGTDRPVKFQSLFNGVRICKKGIKGLKVLNFYSWKQKQKGFYILKKTVSVSRKGAKKE